VLTLLLTLGGKEILRRQAIDAAKFPPVGKRRFVPYCTVAYSFGVGDSRPRADEFTTIILQIDDAERPGTLAFSRSKAWTEDPEFSPSE